jgi:hypothetical protein
MGWLKARLGERTTAYGGALLVWALQARFPQYTDLIQSGAVALGVGLMAAPQQ